MREKTIEAAIIRDLRRLGFHVSKTSQYGKPLGMSEGIPDLHAMHHSWQGAPVALWVEVKSPTGRLRPLQRAWHDAARRCGVAVVVARSTGDVLDHLAGRDGVAMETAEMAEMPASITIHPRREP